MASTLIPAWPFFSLKEAPGGKLWRLCVGIFSSTFDSGIGMFITCRTSFSRTLSTVDLCAFGHFLVLPQLATNRAISIMLASTDH